MNLFTIKMIALASMAIDHLGVFFFPGNIYFRLIGRLSFPLFAWAIANGTNFTGNINRYLIRILLLAVISQIPYLLLFNIYGIENPGLNILFTLDIGIFGIILLKKFEKFFVRVPIVIALSFIAVFIKTDYGAFGVLSVIVFFLYFKSPVKSSIYYFFLIAFFYILPFLINKYLNIMLYSSNINNIEYVSLLSLPIIASYNLKKGYNLKYLFYIFYPLHLTLIYLVAVYLF